MTRRARVMAEVKADELTDTRRGAGRAVQGLITLALALVALAFAGVRLPLPASFLDPKLYGVLWIVILFLGLGAVALRRTRSNPARLQDIAALRGTTGLLASMRKTTLFIALLGGAIALIGFVIFSGWRDEMDMLKAGVLAVAVLLYAYPRRESWRRTAEASQRAGGPVVDSPAKGTTE